ncbi:MAG TPA: LPS assembly protein LptD [Gammaproteobacteria bacterium]
MTPKRSLNLLVWLTLSAPASALAQDLVCAPPAVTPAPNQSPAGAAADDQSQTPIEIVAGEVDLSNAEGVEFLNQVEFRYGDRSISADSAIYDREDGSISVRGTVSYSDPDVTVYGEDAEVDTENEEILFTGAGFDIPARPARGSAQEISIRSDQTIAFSTVNFTTCPQGQTDWELMAGDIELDIDEGFGTARDVKLEFKGVPILYAPYLTFPIDDRRKSGLLTPRFSERDQTGLDISAPYYFNLAPNYDLTLEPRLMSKRGLQLNTEFRYLSPGSEGLFSFEYLPDDSDANRRRSYLSYDHQTTFARGWQIEASLADVSDDAYFEDLGDSQTVASQTHLNRYLDLSYRADAWSLLARFQAYQTIDSLIAAEDRPYERVPQIVFDGSWLGERWRFESTNELVRFDRAVGPTGWRLDSTEELSFPMTRPGMYLTPGLALRQTNYWIDNAAPGEKDNFSRTLPVASIDAGLVFERLPQQESGFIQTLEPRVLYVNRPFEDQSDLPVFDTIEPDFNLVQLFRKYQYVGPDRISDADQVSVGVTARLIDSEDGRERFTATLGQTRYLDTQRVSLPDQSLTESSASDYIAEVSIAVSDAWRLDVDYQWDTETNSTTRAETSVHFTPRDDRYAGFSYRLREGLLEQGDVSLVWPVGQSWRVIGHLSYSFLEEEALDRFLGWEYESCCWRLRLIGRRYISRRTGESDTSISVQLQLRGFSDDAGYPEELLDRGILGYRRFGNTL